MPQPVQASVPLVLQEELALLEQRVQPLLELAPWALQARAHLLPRLHCQSLIPLPSQRERFLLPHRDRHQRQPPERPEQSELLERQPPELLGLGRLPSSLGTLPDSSGAAVF